MLSELPVASRSLGESAACPRLFGISSCGDLLCSFNPRTRAGEEGMVAKGKAETRHVLRQGPLPKYVYHPNFEDRSASRVYLENIEVLMADKRPPRASAETVLFQAMHYCAFRAHCSRGKRVLMTASASRWAERRDSIRDHLIVANLGLSYEMLRRTRFTNVDEDDLLSEGLRALVDAVEAFDPWRGYRFSTYACNAIYRGFLRLSKMETRRSSLISYGFDSRMERGAGEMTAADWDDRVYRDRLAKAMEWNLADLNSQEQYILDKRFPAESVRKRETLERIGREMRVSKERVRQIQVTALEKLRLALTAEPVFG